MNKKLGIIIALVLAVVFTAAIVWTTQNQLQEVKKTVKVAKTADFIPINSKILPEDIEMVQIYDEYAGSMVKDKGKITGMCASVSMIEGQYVYEGNLDDALSKKKGYVGVYIPTNMNSSAMVTAGDKVDVHLINQKRGTEKSVVVYKKARVLHSLDEKGQEIEPGYNPNIGEKVASPGGVEPVTVEVEVPEKLQEKIVQYADNNAVYLTRSGNKQGENNTKEKDSKS
ncbi:MAG: hypothetical protein K9L17_08315 [Clostridiales bacterium]|nr:hypothetical protein [Clostridiales bacterium]MCF8022679.1 hypothetical protein [Clostridiales bacterium]